MGHSGVPIGVYGQRDSIIGGVNAGGRVWTKAQRSCVNARTASAAQGGRFVHTHGRDKQGGRFEGCSAAEVRLNLIPQGRLDARQKGPFDSIKGVNFSCRTLQFFIPYPPSQCQSPSAA
jgi:hypothetical protein